MAARKRTRLHLKNASKKVVMYSELGGQHLVRARF